MEELVSWSLTSLFSTNMAISETSFDGRKDEARLMLGNGWYFVFPSALLTLLVEWQEGHAACKNVVLLIPRLLFQADER